MSMETPVQSGPKTDISELKLAVAYGIEGLEKSQETDEYDSWLDLFGLVAEELDSPSNHGRGNFPLKEFVIPEKDEQAEILESLKHLDEQASELKQREVDKREDLDDISELISKAENIYERFEEIEDATTMY